MSILLAGDAQREIEEILHNDNAESKKILRTPPVGTRHCEELEGLRHSGDQYYDECFKRVRKEIAKAIIMPVTEDENLPNKIAK